MLSHGKGRVKENIQNGEKTSGQQRQGFLVWGQVMEINWSGECRLGAVSPITDIRPGDAGRGLHAIPFVLCSAGVPVIESIVVERHKLW